MKVNPLTHRATVASGRLRVFSLYLDFTASVRARWANRTVSRLAVGNWITSTEMWNLDSLGTSTSLRNMINGEAAEADLLVVALGSLNHRQHELMEWLAALAAWPTDRQNLGLLIGLFDDDEPHRSELTWTVQQCQHCARQMNRDFIWHWMATGTPADDSWLKKNLEPLLARKQKAAEQPLLSSLPTSLPPRCASPAA